jgi:membrane protease YdiL (CAAX protease family)
VQTERRILFQSTGSTAETHKQENQMSVLTFPHLKRVAVERPITTLCVVAIGLTLPLQTALLLAGIDLFIGKLAELVFLTGTAALITSRIGGRSAVRRLFSGLTKWRIGTGRAALVLLAMPILTIGVASATGTLHTPDHGWAGEALTYLVLSVLIALTASLWEETTWSGFVQRRLMDRHGLLAGSMLTAIPFGLIHLPLAFEADGWAETTWSEAFVNWAFLLGALPLLRYVIGVLLVDTKGSVLAAAVLHASFNASGALSVVPAGWQYVPALIILTLLVTVHRRLCGRALVDARVDPDSAAAARAGGTVTAGDPS